MILIPAREMTVPQDRLRLVTPVALLVAMLDVTLLTS